jgi:hypothetical protein
METGEETQRVSRGLGLLTITAVLLVFLLAGAVAKFFLSQDVSLRNDHVISALFFHEMAEHGNYLLKNWYVQRNNYLTTDYPVFAALGLTAGLGPFTLKVGAYLIFAAVCALVFALSYGTFGFFPALVAVVLLAGLPSSMQWLVAPNFHVGTLMFALAGLALTRASARSRTAGRFALSLLVLFLVSSLSTFSDPLHALLLPAPLVFTFFAHRLLTGGWLYPRGRSLLLSAVLLASAVAGLAMEIPAEGLGLHLAMADAVTFTSPVDVPASLKRYAADLAGLLLGPASGDMGLFRALQAAANLSVLVLTVTLALPAYRGRRSEREGFLVMFLASLVLALSAAYLGTLNRQPYYLVPVLVAFCLFAGLSAEHARKRGRKKLFSLFMLLLLAAASLNIADNLLSGAPRGERREAQNAELAAFLRERGLTYGYASLENSNVVTFLSGFDVKVRAVRFDRRTIEPYIWQCNLDWFDYRRHAGPTFLMVEKGETRDGFGHLTPPFIRELFGAPGETLSFGDKTIYVWNHNIIQVYWIERAMPR